MDLDREDYSFPLPAMSFPEKRRWRRKSDTKSGAGHDTCVRAYRSEEARECESNRVNEVDERRIRRTSQQTVPTRHNPA